MSGPPPSPGTRKVLRLADGELEHEWVRNQLERAVTACCPSWLADQREDLVQTAMTKLLKLIDSDRDKEVEVNATYLWRTAYAVVYDEIRRPRHVAERSIEAESGELAIPALSLDPERQAVASQLGREVRDCLGRLAAPRRHAVLLHLLGHTPREIARLTGWASKRVSNLVYRAQQDLRRCLSEKGIAP